MKEKINKKLPYRYKARCLTEKEYNDYKYFREVRTLKLSWEQIEYICDLHSDIFSMTKWRPCSGCSVKPLIGMIDRLDKVFEAYKT